MAQRKWRIGQNQTKRKRTEQYGQGTPGVLAEASQNERGQLLDEPGRQRKRKPQTQRKRSSS